jgi:hypothetical protein
MPPLVANPPKTGCKVRVIGAGLPRTATNSFCAALEILLDGPAYHLGVQTALGGSEEDVLTWIDILERRPYRSEADRQLTLKRMAKLLDGYVVTADPPLSQLVPELMELYPEAVVICSTRDIDSWAKSITIISGLVKPLQQKFIFFWIKNVRWLPKMWGLLHKIFDERFGMQPDTEETAKLVWERNRKWLQEIVPNEKLFFADVKDGWQPLCQALNLPIPKDVEFPRLNDGKAMEEIFRSWAMRGLLIWAAIFGIFAIGVGFALKYTLA